MAKVIGAVPLDRVDTWNTAQEKRQDKLANIKRRRQIALDVAEMKTLRHAQSIMREKERKENFVPHNMQLREQLHDFLTNTPSMYYNRLPKFAV